MSNFNAVYIIHVHSFINLNIDPNNIEYKLTCSHLKTRIMMFVFMRQIYINAMPYVYNHPNIKPNRSWVSVALLLINVIINREISNLHNSLQDKISCMVINECDLL